MSEEQEDISEWVNKDRCKGNNKFVKVNEYDNIKYIKDSIEKEINNIIINKLNAEKKQIEDIALNVISGYKSILLEHMQTTIIKSITEGLENHLNNGFEKDKITEKIVEANVTNFNDLLSGREDKSSSNVYSDLLNFDKVCEAKAKAAEAKAKAEEEAKAKAEEEAKKAKAEEEAKKAKAQAGGGRPKRKKYTRKSHRKRNKQQTRRFKGGENDKCIDVSAICKKVTEKIIEQTEKFKTEINKIKTTEIETTETETIDSNIGKLKEKIQKICLYKTDELLDDFAKQAIDISSLDDIFKILIFEITNVVKSNMKELDKTICKKK